MGYIGGEMEENMKDIGKKVNSMEKVFILTLSNNR